MANRVIEKATDGTWEFKLRNLGRFDEVFGRNVLSSFCRCFVHVDRLNSLISCMHVSAKYHGQDSVAYTRDLNTLVWFTVGTLRELARAIQGLQTALMKCGRLNPKSAPWITLRKLVRRWENDDDYRRMRDKVAFHVDQDVIESGLNVLIENEDDVTLAEGRGSKHVASRLTLGLLALHNGLDLDLDGYREFLEAVLARIIRGNWLPGRFSTAADCRNRGARRRTAVADVRVHKNAQVPISRVCARPAASRTRPGRRRRSTHA